MRKYTVHETLLVLKKKKKTCKRKRIIFIQTRMVSPNYIGFHYKGTLLK